MLISHCLCSYFNFFFLIFFIKITTYDLMIKDFTIKGWILILCMNKYFFFFKKITLVRKNGLGNMNLVP